MKIDRKMLFKNSNQLILESFSNEQNYLDLINKKKYSSDEALEILENIDWDFKSFSTQYLTHTFHPYPARFIPQIPLTFIKLFTKERERVLDPMCGCGTTLVEAFLNDRNSIGNDLNPLAALIAKVKTTLIKKDEFKYLNEKLIKMKKYLDLDYRNIDRTINGLPNRKVSKIFNKTIISKLEIIRETLIEIKEEGYYDLFDLGRIALSSTIWSLVENGNGINVDELFIKKIKSMQQILSQMSKVIKDPPDVKVICGDARNLSIENNSIDLIITSPPYVNALDYYRVHMYNMLWLGMDFDLFRKHEIGGIPIL